MESSNNIQPFILSANEDVLRELKSTETLQLSVYNQLLDLLTKDIFFEPLLKSKSKELVGRFCLQSTIAIHASYISYGASEYMDTPGHFEIEFTASGIPNISASFDSHFCEALSVNPSPFVKKIVRAKLEALGWKAWWYDGKFNFQSIPDSELIKEAIYVGKFYNPIPEFNWEINKDEWKEAKPVSKSPLLFDHTAVTEKLW